MPDALLLVDIITAFGILALPYPFLIINKVLFNNVEYG